MTVEVLGRVLASVQALLALSGVQNTPSRDTSAKRSRSSSGVGTRNFLCDTCGKAFVDNSALRRHLRTHTGEKPFACGTCGRRFSDLSSCIRHERLHDGDNESRYTCEFCGKAYSRNEHLRKHMHKCEKASRTHDDGVIADSPREDTEVCPVVPFNLERAISDGKRRRGGAPDTQITHEERRTSTTSTAPVDNEARVGSP